MGVIWLGGSLAAARVCRVRRSWRTSLRCTHVTWRCWARRRPSEPSLRLVETTIDHQLPESLLFKAFPIDRSLGRKFLENPGGSTLDTDSARVAPWSTVQHVRVN